MQTQVQPRIGQRIAVTVILVIAVGLGLGFARWMLGGLFTGKNPATVAVEANQVLATAPHAFDVFRPSNATKAIVFLHGGGGTKEQVEYILGVKTTSDTNSYTPANPQWLISNKVMAVFPQGQAIPLSQTYTWSNYVMTSGEDDVQFLDDLASYIKSHYHINNIILAGHSNGGMMTARVWCERPDLFDVYVAFSGPPSEHFLDAATPCAPSTAKPFMAVVGSDDGVLRDSDWEAQTWTINPLLTAGRAFLDPVLIGERYFLPTRVAARCNGTVGAGESDATTVGVTTTWRYCDNAVQLKRINGASHEIDSLQTVTGQKLPQLTIDFAKLFITDTTAPLTNSAPTAE